MTSLLVIWQAFKLLMTYLPALVDAIQRGEDYVELKVFIKKVEAAEAQAKEQDDTRPLNDLLPK